MTELKHINHSAFKFVLFLCTSTWRFAPYIAWPTSMQNMDYMIKNLLFLTLFAKTGTGLVWEGSKLVVQTAEDWQPCPSTHYMKSWIAKMLTDHLTCLQYSFSLVFRHKTYVRSQANIILLWYYVYFSYRNTEI